MVAEDTWSAMQAISALRVDWNPGPNADYDTEAYTDELISGARGQGQERRSNGDFEAAFAVGRRRTDHAAGEGGHSCRSCESDS